MKKRRMRLENGKVRCSRTVFGAAGGGIAGTALDLRRPKGSVGDIGIHL